MKKLTKDLRFTPRKEQQNALDFIAKYVREDKTKKFFLLDLPTGVGKSYLAMMISKWFMDNVNKNTKFDVLTCQKVLQKQYVDEFEAITNLWGSDNYQCSQYSCSCKQGKEFNRLNKTKCDGCPYDDAKESFVSDKISMTNFHLYALYSLFRPDILETRGSDVLIVDEAHDIESIFSDFISISLTEMTIKKLKFNNNYQITKALNKIKGIEDFVEFLQEFLINECSKSIGSLKRQMKSRDPKFTNRNLKLEELVGDKGDASQKKIIQAVNDLESFLVKIEHFLEDYKKNPENWVCEITPNKNDINDIKVEPIWSHPYLDKYIWSQYKYVILMSGTILDKDMFSYLNGINGSEAVYYQIESPFEVKNRPIYYMPIGRMTYKDKQSTWQKYLPWIKKLMKKYQNEKGIIHTNSFEFVGWMKKDVKDKRLLLHFADKNKDMLLRTHYISSTPTVLCSPSMTTGVDLADDRARFQLMLKVPYPSLGSQKNKLRMKQHKDWYAWRTVATMIQMYGRAVRNYQDSAHFIILDGCFKDIMDYSSRFIPNYVKKAIKRVDVHKMKQ